MSIEYLNMHRSRLLPLSIKQLLQLQYICWTLTERAMPEDTDLCRRMSFKCCCKLKPVTKRSNRFWMMLTDWQRHCRMAKQKWNPKSVQKLFWLFALTAHLPQIAARGFDTLGSPCAGENKETPTFKLSPQLLLFRVFGLGFCLGFLILHSSLPGAFVCKDEKKSIFLKMSASLRHWNQKMGEEGRTTHLYQERCHRFLAAERGMKNACLKFKSSVESVCCKKTRSKSHLREGKQKSQSFATIIKFYMLWQLKASYKYMFHSNLPYPNPFSRCHGIWKINYNYDKRSST